jgi:predicted AAA+ superfamily ATPase
MNLEEIKRVVISQREEVEEKFRNERIIDREPEINSLKRFLTHPNILAILGIRRSGKSVFSWQISKGECSDTLILMMNDYTVLKLKI